MDEFELTGEIQRIFRARQKLDSPHLISHITQRAAGKEPLFLEDKDYLTLLGLLRESVDKFSLRYYALCLMPNHVHLLLEPEKRNLAQAMRSIFSRYAAKFNHRYERRGHLFGGPYRQSVCLDPTYLLTASVYIHLNPVRGGLCENPSDYRWSSCALYCQDKPGKSFVDPSPILQLLDEDVSTAREDYRQLLQSAMGEEPENAFEIQGAIEKFCIRLAEICPSLVKKLGQKTRKKKNHSPALLELTELECRLQELGNNRSRTPESKKAKRYIVEQLLARGYKKTEIAKRLGISRTAVYDILNFTDRA